MTITYKEFLKMQNCWYKTFIFEGLIWEIDDINNKDERLCITKEIKNGRVTEVARKMNYNDIIELF